MYALQNEVPTATILNSTDITMETRAQARLAGHIFIVDAVQNFRHNYPDWKLSITELLSDLGAKHRTKKKPNGKNAIKAKTQKKSIVVKNSNETNTNNKKPKNTQSESEEALSEFEDTQFERVKSESGSEEFQSNFKDTINKTDSNESGITSEEIYTESTPITNIPPTQIRISCNEKNKGLESLVSSKTLVFNENKKNVNKCSKSIKPSQIEEINVLDTQLPKLVENQLSEKNLDLSTDRPIDNVNIELEKKSSKRKSERNVSSKDYKKRIMADDIKPVCKTVDSFFMTADDKDYMSVYKPTLPPPEEKSLEKYPKSDYHQPPKEIFSKGKKVAFIKNKQNYTGNRRERRQQEVEEPIDTALHPSWEAKRKQKALAAFTGKKTTFDDDD